MGLNRRHSRHSLRTHGSHRVTKRRNRPRRFTSLIGEWLEPRNLLTGTASIAGVVWNDADGDGARGTNEAGQSGVTVYLDVNDNNALDAGEPTKVSAADGSYSFQNLDSGNYVVREVAGTNHRITSPQASGQRLFVVNYATTPHTINELNYQTGAVIRSFTAPAGSSSAFNGSGLAYDGQTLYFASGSPRTIYKLNPDTGALLDSAVIGGTYSNTIAMRQGKVLLNGSNSISIFDPATNTITGSLTFPDGASLSGPLGYSTATDELLTAGYYRVSFLSSTTGVLTHSFEISYGFDVTGVEMIGNEIFVSHTNGKNIEVYGGSGGLLRTLTTAFSPTDNGGYADMSGSNRLTLTAGQAAVNVNFGDAVSGIRGTRWQDANSNGVRDSGEVPLSGMMMYLDLNDNGSLDIGEPTTLTQNDGSYAFNNLAAGSYAVREVITSGRSQTYPLNAKTRLFIYGYVPSKIYELDPNTGAVINSFNAPFTGSADLAFDGTTLYAILDVSDTLYKLNPDTGAKIASAVLPSGFYVGLAAANGMLYSYPISNRFTVIDPIAMKVVGTLTTSPNSETLWTVGQMTNPDRVMGLNTNSQVVTFDPTTGAESVGFTVAGVASVIYASASGPKLYVSDNNGHINVYSMSDGALLQTLNFAPNIDGLVYRLGSDGAQRITLTTGQLATGVDFGTTELTLYNQPPTLATITDPLAIAKDGSAIVNLSGISAGTFESQTLTITATSSNPTVVPNPTVNYTSAQATGVLTITPASSQIGTAVITVTVKDNGGTLNGGNDTLVRTFTVIVNDSPVLDATKTPTLVTVNEDPGAPSGAVGTLVSSLVDFATPSGQVDNVTDIDSGAQLGIAVTAVDSSLACFYSLNDGSNWTGFGTVSEASARLIAADNDNRVYCQPGLNANGTFASALTFRAWDQTTGTDGGTANATVGGGGTAFSTATDSIGLTVTPVNDPPTATNLNAGQLYTEDTPKNLLDIVVSDVDSATVTATLTLSNPAAGSLSTATSGAVTSTYVAATGVWTTSGAIANVNALLAGLVFNPAQDFNGTFTIATSVSDDGAATITGSQTVTGSAVNDAPKGTNLNASEIYTVNTSLNLIDIVVSDVDSPTLAAKLTLSNSAAGTLSTGTSGAVTSAYNAATGVWTASGAIADVNALLARVTFNPAPNFNSNFAIATSISDGDAADVTGIKSMLGPTNIAPTATNLNAAETFTEDMVMSLVDIVVSDVDNPTVTATLTLSNPAAGIFYPGTSGAVTSTFNAGTGVWTASGAIGNVNTLLAALYFVPTKDFNSNFTIATSISDGGAVVVSGSKAITGTPVNDAPVLDATKSFVLPDMLEDPGAPSGAVGILISSLVDFAVPSGGIDNVSDVDAGALLGVAVTSVASGLTCYFSLDGGVFWSVMNPAPTVARLIAADSDNRMYCMPNLNVSGVFPTAVTFGAWDQTSGGDGGIGNWTDRGGTAAFSSNTETISLTVTPVYDSPTATNLNAAESYTEDAALNLINIVISAPDSTAVTATLTLSNPAAGSLNTGTSGAVTSTFNASTGVWTASGPTANVNTLLAGLTFTPVKDFNGGFTIDSRISDGVGVDATGSKALTGIAVNDAPVLDATKSPALADVDEDSGAPSGAVGTLVSSLVDFAVPSGEVDNVADVDASALLGVAIAGIGSGLTCYYSLDGGNTWSGMGTVSTTVNRLIAADSDNRIYCQAGLNVNGLFASALTFRAWDRSSVGDGILISTATNGGITAFSSNTDTISLTVTPVNDAPTATNLNAAESYTEDTAKSLTDIVVSDIDSTTVTATFTLSIPAAGRLNTGTSGAVVSTYNSTTGIWKATGAVANVNTLLAGLTFTPTANFNGNFSISTSVSDGAADITGTKAFTGVAVNDAPVLDTTKTPTLADVPEGFLGPFLSSAVGTLVSDLVDFATPSGGVDNVTDVDSGALLGVAITAVDSNLQCYYSLDGGSVWQTFFFAGPAYLLAADSDNRIVCRALLTRFNGTLPAALTFHAWDRSLGGDGGSVVIAPPPIGSPTGGTTPLSAATDTIKLTITGVNDAPAATNLNAAESYTEDTPLDLIDIVASDPDSSSLTATLFLSNASAGTLSMATSGAVTSTYDAGTGVWMASGAIADVNRLLAGVVFNPTENFNGNFSINASVSDGEFTVNGIKVITGRAVNDAPTATNLSAAETYTEDTRLDLTDIVVGDVDNSVLTATLTLLNVSAGSLSTATSGATTSTFNAGTGVWTAAGPIADVNALLARVSFVPALDFNGSFTIATSVSDGIAAAITDSKAMTGIAVNDAPTATNLSAAEVYTEDAPLNLVDIVVADVDSATVTAKLTLSNTSAGTVSTGTSGAVTSTFNPGTGVWSASGAVADVNALLVGVSFSPALNFNGNFTILTNVSDGVAAAVTGSKAVTGTAVNDAPVLNSGESPALSSVLEDPGPPSGAVGSLVSSLADLTTPLGGLDNVTEADSDSLLGIAVVGSDPNLTCYFSLNGGTAWAPLGAVSIASARLIAADADNRVYCEPGLNLNGNFAAALTFRAWDQTSGIDGSTADTTSSGGTTAFSTSTDGVGILVQAVNDAPVKNGTSASLPPSFEDSLDPPGYPVANLFGSVFSDVDGTTIAFGGVAIIANAATSEQGTWQFQIGNGPFNDFPNLVDPSAVIVLTASDHLRFLPAPDFNGIPGGLIARLWDGTGSFHSSDLVQDVGTSIGGSGAFADSASEVTLGTTILPVNDPPFLAPFSGSSTAADENPLTHGPALQTTELLWAKNFGPGAPDETSQKLNFQVTNNNNGLFAVQPAIDSQGNLTYTPKPNMHGTATVTVVLKDDAGGNNTSASQQFDIVITKPHRLHNTAFDGQRIGLDVTGSTSAAPDGLIVAADVLAVINYINANGSGKIQATSRGGPPYCDVNGDGAVVGQDALLIINYINAHAQSEGEYSAAPSVPTLSADLLALIALDLAESAQPRKRS